LLNGEAGRYIALVKYQRQFSGYFQKCVSTKRKRKRERERERENFLYMNTRAQAVVVA
jgi:hypothetical protein